MDEFKSIGLTVIIPLGSEKRIDPTIHSVFLQDLEELEVFIIYNGVSHSVSFDYSNLENPHGIPLFQISLLKKGKGHAINKGIQESSFGVVAIVDADCVLAPHALERALSHFFRDDVMVVGGRLKVLETRNQLQIIQKLQYERVFNLSRVIYNKLDGDCLVSGAFGLFRKDSLELMGGFSTDTVGEDMDIILRLQCCLRPRGMKIVYERKAICYTGVPLTLSRLFRQRDRWQRGLLDCLLRNRILLFNRHYGALGLLCLPYQLFFELLKPLHISFGLLTFLILAVMHLVRIQSLWIGFCSTICFQWILCLIAELLGEHNTSFSLKKLFHLLYCCSLDVLLQIPLSVIRIYGMITFPWRKHVW